MVTAKSIKVTMRSHVLTCIMKYDPTERSYTNTIIVPVNVFWLLRLQNEHVPSIKE